MPADIVFAVGCTHDGLIDAPHEPADRCHALAPFGDLVAHGLQFRAGQVLAGQVTLTQQVAVEQLYPVPGDFLVRPGVSTT